MNKLSKYDIEALDLLKAVPPELKAAAEKNVKRMREIEVDHMLIQYYHCRFAAIKVTREINKIKIEWSVLTPGKNEEQIKVDASVTDVQLIPHPEKLTRSTFYQGNGNGSVALELEEGNVYQFDFNFVDIEDAKKNDYVRVSEDKHWLDAILFQVAIPFSDEKKELFKKAVLITSSPAESIRHELEKFRAVEDVFDEMSVKVIENIKSRKLPEHEEQNKIERFLEKAERLREELGM